MKYKSIVLPIIFIVFPFTFCRSQNTEQITLGQVFQSLKSINTKSNLNLRYEKYKSFSFQKFTPLGVVLDSSKSFVEVAYDNGQVKEIIHRNTIVNGMTYKMRVFDYAEFRILLTLATVESKQRYHYLPIAFVMMKDRSLNLMINVVSMYGFEEGTPHVGVEYSDFPLTQLENVSVIMRLDKDLYPLDFVRLFKKRIVYEGEILYKKDSKIIDCEMGGFFLAKPENQILNVDENTLLGIDFFAARVCDLKAPLYPRVLNKSNYSPLWIFNGAHDYIKCGLNDN